VCGVLLLRQVKQKQYDMAVLMDWGNKQRGVRGRVFLGVVVQVAK